MFTPLPGNCRYFATYSGVRLPFKLSQELPAEAIANRNTYFCGYFDAQGYMTGLQKIVYDELEMQHEYLLDGDGKLLEAIITNVEGEVTELAFS